jgi:hypothetical protein
MGVRRASLALLGVSVIASLGVLAQARQADVSGDWELVVQTRHGEMTSTVKFVQEGEKLRVSMAEPRGGDTTGEGTIKGSDIQWSIIRDTARGKLTIIYKGTVQGATMSGEAQIGDRDSAPWKAAKK